MAKEYIERKALTEEIERLLKDENCRLDEPFRPAYHAGIRDVRYIINSLPTQEDKSDTYLLNMLLEAINYAYRKLDGKYGNLSYVVSDKVKYIERVRAEKIEQKKREEYEARERGEAKSEVDLDAEFERFLDDVEGVPRMYHSDEQMEWGKDLARHFAEWGAEHARELVPQKEGYKPNKK